MMIQTQTVRHDTFVHDYLIDDVLAKIFTIIYSMEWTFLFRVPRIL